MAITLDASYPYDGQAVNEDQWRKFAKYLRYDGVIRGVGSEFAPFGDSTGMQVKVGSGECWIAGQFGENLTQETLSIAASHPSLGRRDLVILRNDFLLNRIELDVLTGTPAASPAYPGLTQNTSKWEIMLGKVVVGANVSTITAGDVTPVQTFVDGSCSYTIDTNFQSIGTAGDPKRVDWDTELFRSSGVDRTGTNGINAFTVRRPGLWLITGSVEWTANTAGRRECWVARTSDGLSSGNRFGFTSHAPNVSGSKLVQGFSCQERFALNEELAVYVWQDSGATLQLTKDFTSTRVQMSWLGP